VAEQSDVKTRRIDAIRVAIAELVAALAKIAEGEPDSSASLEFGCQLKHGDGDAFVEVFDDGAVLWNPKDQFADIRGRTVSQIYSPPARPRHDQTCPRCQGRGKI
jgi:hypothetical protein